MIAILTAGVIFAPASYAQDAVPAAQVPQDAAPPAQAPQAEAAAAGSLKEIVVTANKRSENLQDVPIAISAVTAESLERANITSTADIGMLVPGLNLQVGNLNFSPYIRGVGTTAANAGADNSVQTYVDGVLLSAYTSGLAALNNIQQIEVNKGPQGTLFGRNTTGGVISITTKTPQHEFGSDTIVSYGNYNTIALNQYLTGGITSTIAADVAVYYSHQDDGWGKNLFTGSEIFKEKSFAIRSKILWEPGPNDTITFSADYNKINSSIYAAETIVPGTFTNWGPGNTTAAERPDMAAGVASGAILPTFVVGQPYSHDGLGDYDVNVVVDPSSKLWGWGGSGKWRHDFGAVSLNYIGAYREYREDVIWSPSPSPNFGQIAGWGNGTTTLTQELNIQSDARSKVQWVAGVFYLDSSVEYVRPFFIEGTSINGVTAPGSGFSRLNFFGDQKTKSYAAYGQVTIPIVGDKTELTLGARYTRDKKSIVGSLSFNQGPLYTGFLPPEDQPEIPAGDIAGKDTFSKATYRIALSHKFTDDVMAYASFNTGFKSGGYNMIPPSSQAYNPETIKAWEVGVKTELFDRRVRFNAAAFLYNWSDLQVTVYENTSAVTVNAAKARLYGIDADITAKVTDRLTLTGGVSVLEHEFTSYPNATFNVPQAQGGGNVGVAGSAKGNKLPYASDFTANAMLDYRAPLANGEFGLNLSYYYNGGFKTTADNFIGEDGYHLLNARVEWTMPDGRTTFSIWGKNVTDTLYATLVRANVNPGGFTVRNLGAPRTFGASVRYAF